MTHKTTPFLLLFILWSLTTPPTLAQSTDAALRRALTAAEAGQAVPELAHPAQGWVEYATLRRRLSALSAAEAQAFLDRHQGQAVAEVFRSAWLRAAYERKMWVAIRKAWSADITDVALRCIALEARQHGGDTGPEWTQAVQDLWSSSATALPEECDAAIAALDARGGLNDELRWQRLEQAAAAGEVEIMRAVANGLSPSSRALGNDYAAFIDAPHANALTWPKTARSRLIAMHGLTRLARRRPREAIAQLPRYIKALELTDTETGPVRYQIALQTAANWASDAAQLLDQVPDAAYDRNLHEWRVRIAIARKDWAAVRAAVEKMEPEQRAQSRWAWFAARAAEALGESETAQTLYRQAATQPDFHGFLAADTLNLPYALCPQEVSSDLTKMQAIAQNPAILRAMALYRIGRIGWATREWNAALSGFDDDERRRAVRVALDNGWLDRAAFAMNRAPSDQRYYTLRFPLNYTDIIRREAKARQLDPAWVAAEIRAESVFNPHARSPANARGLMQVLPSTAQGVSRRLGLRWQGPNSLYDPETNITLGTAYLREKEEMYPAPYIAIAAYNAGPVATQRWQTQRPNFDPDLWIETIGYRETREYVARILAFSVIYDWRMHGDALPIRARMLGQASRERKAFVCPLEPAAS